MTFYGKRINNLLFRQGQQLEGGFGCKEGGKDFVSNLEDVLEFRTHSMVLGGQKGRIQDDTYGHSRFKKHVVSHSEHKISNRQNSNFTGNGNITIQNLLF